MMDVREAIKALTERSTLLLSRIHLRERMLKFEVPEAKDVIEELIAALKVETRQALVLSILVSESLAKHADRIVIGFIDELPELLEAINRIEAATAEARKATLAHEEKSRIDEPGESPAAKAIEAFLARRRSGLNEAPANGQGL
jgi:hypothetical protein